MSEIHRQIPPIPDVTRPGPITYDAKDPDTSFPPIRPLMPPPQAPNVMLIMLDDVGFGAPSTFGGPCQTPVFDRLAQNGLRYTRFHTTALCSPSRQALLTGRNHHSLGMGGVPEIATSAAVPLPRRRDRRCGRGRRHSGRPRLREPRWCLHR